MQKNEKQNPSQLICSIGRPLSSHLPSASSGLRVFLSSPQFCPWFNVCPSGSQFMQKPISLLVYPIELYCSSERNYFVPAWNAASSSASQLHRGHRTLIPGSSAPLLGVQGVPSRVLGKGCLSSSYGCSPHERQDTRSPDPYGEGGWSPAGMCCPVEVSPKACMQATKSCPTLHDQVI